VNFRIVRCNTTANMSSENQRSQRHCRSQARVGATSPCLLMSHPLLMVRAQPEPRLNGGHQEHKRYRTSHKRRLTAIAADAAHPGKEALKAQGADSGGNNRTHHLAQSPWRSAAGMDQMPKSDNDEHGTRTIRRGKDAARGRQGAVESLVHANPSPMKPVCRAMRAHQLHVFVPSRKPALRSASLMGLRKRPLGINRG
jgi:hypothetical protein